MKGTASKGKRASGKNHIICRRCGQHARNVSTGICSSCGYGKSSKIRKYKWMKESKR